jgi:hypothetical protein
MTNRTMNRIGLGFLLGLSCVLSAAADPPADAPPAGGPCGGGICRLLWTRWCPPTGCGPNDYVAKPCPPIAPIGHCGSCDDYCKKPLPFVPPISRCGSCDDYCKKPLPTNVCPPSFPPPLCAPAEIPPPPSCVPAAGRYPIDDMPISPYRVQ